MLTVEGCRARQKRLLAALDAQGLAGALLAFREHVYYFTGYRCHWNHAGAAYLSAQGKLTLVGWKVDANAVAADEILEYPAHKHATMPSEQPHLAAMALARALPPGKLLGTDLLGAGALTQRAGPMAVDLTSTILGLRKKKDADEIACLRKAIAVSEAMYAFVKETIEPDLDEFDFFVEIRAAAMLAAGEDLERFGNDYCSGKGGGFPRRRPMQAGELYVIDAGPSLHGYHADNCRTFAVDRKGTDVQHAACAKIIACLKHLEGKAKPGVTGQALYDEAKAFLADAGHSGLVHHLGHGIGLAPHEAPQLNPEFESVLEAGDVFTMEPGLYSKELNAGIRLEQNYLVTDAGLERLTSFPLELV